MRLQRALLWASCVLCLVGAAAFPRTIGANKFQKYEITSARETVVFEHAVSAGNVGLLTYFWTTAGGHPLERYVSDNTIVRIFIDGEENASLQFTPALAAGSGVGLEGGAYYQRNDSDPTRNCSAWPYKGPEVCGMDLLDGWPWETPYTAKLGAESSWALSFPIPFGRSVRVTAQAPGNSSAVPPEFRRPDLPASTVSSAFVIIRGLEGSDTELSVRLGPLMPPLPPIGQGGLRLQLRRLHRYTAAKGAMVPLVEYEGAGQNGRVVMVTVVFDGMRAGLDIEGCWWGLTSPNASAAAPNADTLLLGTGTEDFYGAAYGLTWTERMFHTGLSGLTHVRGGPTPDRARGGGGHPPGAPFFSAYRLFDKDPLMFQQRLALYWRNGGPKCGPAPAPTPEEQAAALAAPCRANCVSAYVWFYTFHKA